MAVFLKTLQKTIKLVCCLTLSVMSIIVFIQVINRNIFEQSYVWVEEMSAVFMVWITYLGAAAATMVNTHTRIDYFIRLLPNKITKCINVFDYTVCLIFVATLGYYTIPLIKQGMKTFSPILRFPMAVNYIGIAVSAILMAVYFIIYIGIEIQEIRLGRESNLRKELAQG